MEEGGQSAGDDFTELHPDAAVDVARAEDGPAEDVTWWAEGRSSRPSTASTPAGGGPGPCWRRPAARPAGRPGSGWRRPARRRRRGRSPSATGGWPPGGRGGGRPRPAGPGPGRRWRRGPRNGGRTEWATGTGDSWETPASTPHPRTGRGRPPGRAAPPPSGASKRPALRRR